MKISNHIDMQGRMHLQVADRSGTVIREVEADNDIVRSGRELVARLFISNNAIDKQWHLAVGKSGGAVDRQQENLLDEIPGGRIPVKPFEEGDLTTTGDQKKKLLISAVLDFEHPSNGQVLREAGLFTQATDGKMYNRVTFDPVSKTPDFKLTVVWEIIF